MEAGHPLRHGSKKIFSLSPMSETGGETICIIRKKPLADKIPPQKIYLGRYSDEAILYEDRHKSLTIP